MITALGVQAAVLVLAMAGAPFVLRLPLALLYAFGVPGFAVVGLLRLSDPTTEVALSLIASVALGTAAAQLLVWLGLYSLGATLAALAVPTTVGLLAQLRAEADAPRERRRDLLWPRSYWS